MVDKLKDNISALLEKRKQDALRHPETKLYLLTLSRLIRTGTTTVSEPLGQMTLASYLKMVGWNVEVFNGSSYDGFNYLKTIKEKTIKEKTIKASNKTERIIIGLFADYENLNLVSSICRKIKENMDWPVIVGGPQAVGLDEAYLRKNPWVDLFIRGDGEYSVSDVLSAMSENNNEKLNSIHGIGRIYEGRYIDNGISDSLMNMDEGPSLDSSCLVNQFPRSVLIALSGRGCPFHCSFCYEGGNSKMVRLRSVEHMLKEIKKRLEYHKKVKYIYFGDDTFTLQPDRLKAFCDGLKELRKQYDFVWFADGHVNVLLKHPEYVKMMVDAGLVRMQIGIESCNQNIIDLYNKNIKREDLFSVLDLCLESKLPQLAGNIIIGGACETRETALETFETIYELLRRSRGMLDVSHTLYSNFPGTDMFKNQIKFGIRTIDQEGLTSFGDFPTSVTETLSREEIASLASTFMTDSIKVMRQVIHNGQADEEILEKSVYLCQKYGISSQWVSLAMSRNEYRFYSYSAFFGRKELCNNTIPLRSVFFHGQEDYTSEVPSVDGFVLSPFEDELYSYCAGKLNFSQICKVLWHKHSEIFGSFEEMESFVRNILEDLKKYGLLVYTDLNGNYSTDLAGNCLKESPIKFSEETKVNMSIKNNKKPNKVILFYPYTIAGSIHNKTKIYSLGIFTLGAVLKQKGFEVKTCECSTAEIFDYVRSENDGTILAVGLSIDYENRRHILTLSNLISKLGLNVLIGGVDARTITEDELRESNATAVLKGEGEITLPEVCNALSNDTSLENISGLLLLKDNVMIDTGAEVPPMDLDAIPFPDYSLSMVDGNKSSFTIITSRGCPNKCVFCHEGYSPSKLRFRSIENVLEELEGLLKNYPELKYIVFADDTLVLKPTRIDALCAGIKKLQQKYHSFAWYCEADIRSLYNNPQMLPKMIDAGLVRLQVGIESGDEEMLKLYGKPSSNEMVRSVVKHAYDCGLLSMVGPILVGAPFENEDHVKIEKAWIEELLTLAPGTLEIPISIISPYIQTKIGQFPQLYGYTFTDAEGDRSNTDFPAYFTSSMSEKEILKAYQDLAFTCLRTVRKLIDEHKVPVNRLLDVMKAQQTCSLKSFWLEIIAGYYFILNSYLQLRCKTNAPALKDIDDGELENWHLQRTMEIWRFVSFSDFGPRIGSYFLSPYEYQILLYCAGKLSIKEIAQKLYPEFGMDEGMDKMLERVKQTAMEFEDRFWVVAVEF